MSTITEQCLPIETLGIQTSRVVCGFWSGLHTTPVWCIKLCNLVSQGKNFQVHRLLSHSPVPVANLLQEYAKLKGWELQGQLLCFPSFLSSFRRSLHSSQRQWVSTRFLHNHWVFPYFCRRSLSRGEKEAKTIRAEQKKIWNRRLNPPRGPGESTLAYIWQLAQPGPFHVVGLPYYIGWNSCSYAKCCPIWSPIHWVKHAWYFQLAGSTGLRQVGCSLTLHQLTVGPQGNLGKLAALLVGETTKQQCHTQTQELTKPKARKRSVQQGTSAHRPVPHLHKSGHGFNWKPINLSNNEETSQCICFCNEAWKSLSWLTSFSKQKYPTRAQRSSILISLPRVSSLHLHSYWSLSTSTGGPAWRRCVARVVQCLESRQIFKHLLGEKKLIKYAWLQSCKLYCNMEWELPEQEPPFCLCTKYWGQAVKQIRVGFLRDLANPAGLARSCNLGSRTVCHIVKASWERRFVVALHLYLSCQPDGRRITKGGKL